MKGSKQRRSRRWRRLLWVLVAVLALPLLLGVVLEFLVRLPPVRGLIQGRIVTEISERTGLELDIGRLALSLWHSSASIEDLAVRVPGEASLLEAERIEVGWRLSSLWEGPPTLRRLEVVGPELDLEAPLPEPTGEGEESEASFAFAIEHFELRDGRVDAPVLPAELEDWIRDWWLEDLTVQGRYGPGGLASALTADLAWRRTDEVDVEVDLSAVLEGPQLGPWQLSQLVLEGPGLKGMVDATYDPTKPDSPAGRFDLTVEPHLLIPVPRASEPMRLRGDLTGRQGPLEVQLAAVGVPLEWAEPWMADGALEDPRIESWRADLDADLSLSLVGDELEIDGGSHLSLARAETIMAAGEVRFLGADGPGATLTLELLPERRGRRSLAAMATTSSWSAVEDIAISDGRIEIVATDVETVLRDLEPFLPQPPDDDLEARVAGRLDAAAKLEGPLADPHYELTAAWRHRQTEDRLALDLTGSLERVTITSASGSLEGYDFEGRGAADLELPVARAEAELTLAQPLPEVDSLALALRLHGGVLEVSGQPQLSNGVTPRIDAEIPLASLSDLPEAGAALATLPVVQARGPVEVRWQVPRAEWRGLLAGFAPQVEVSELWLGSSGEATLDVAQPLASKVDLRLEGLAIEAENVAITSRLPIQLRLQNREVILEATRLETEGGVLEVEAWTRIASGWRPGAPIGELVEQFRLDANGAAPLALLGSLVEDVQTDGDLQVAVSLAGSLGELQGEVRVLGPDAVAIVGEDPSFRLADPIFTLAFDGTRMRLEKGYLRIDDGLIEATGEVDVNAEEPFRSAGWIEIAPLDLTFGGYRVENDGPLRLELADTRLDLGPLRLVVEDQPFELGGWVDLDPDALSEEGSRAQLVESFDLEGTGTVAAIWLNPILQGGIADGLLDVDFEVAGTLADPAGRIRVEGPEASVLFLAPYVAKIEAPELDLELKDGRLRVRDGRVVLNGGDVELDGSLGLDGADLFAAFDGLRFRLDYGLFVRLDGDLELDVDGEGRGVLSGTVLVDQGSLTRPISIDRDFLTDLLSPIDLSGTEESLLENIELDLTLNTRRGVRVRNNVADLAVGWNDVKVRGTVLQPVIDGQFRVEPGGRAFLFGQTLRVDRGVMTFPGQPGEEGILELETTSSLEDPSISRLAGDESLSLSQFDRDDEGADYETRAREAGWSAATFVSEQLASKIAEAVPAARLTFRPILIFGEADPGARLTIGRDFSRYVTLAASIDLRNAERQTYLMDAHDIPGLPGLVVQVFTNDLEQEGATIQHRLRLGSYRRTAPTGPQLRRVEIDEVPNVSQRALRRSVGISKGDRASEDDLFLAEVEIGEFLRSKGYPDARVELRSRPVPERADRIDLDISIAPGPLVGFTFVGEELPRSLQRQITPLYRGDFYEPVALEEMQMQTVRALRSLGFPEPRVEVTVESETGPEGQEQRQVTIAMQGGERVELDELEIVGLPEPEAEVVTEAFNTRLQRAELAAGLASADRRLVAVMRSLGYSQPQILERALVDGTRRLRIEVEPGRRSYLDSVAIRGVDAAEAARLQQEAGVSAGDVARRDRIASGALAIERRLASEGYANARVRSLLEVEEPDGEGAARLVYEVDPGELYTVQQTEFDGLRSTSKRWATNVAEIESGAPLREDEVAAARSRLYETGLFTMVSSESFETEGGGTDVRFNVEERPRFSVAYGLRWDSDEGTQGVVDLVDQNFLGRGVVLGLRTLYKQDDWNVRLGAGVPRLFGTRATLEIYGSYQDLFDEEEDEFFISQFDEQVTEASLQVAYPFSRNISGRFYGRYRQSELVITDIEKDPDPDFPLPPFVLDFQFTTPILGTLWIYDTRDRELVINRGVFASMDLSGTGEALDSDFEYVRLFTQFNLYKPFLRWAGGRRLSWAQSLRLGLADSFDQELDRDDRFFAGGQYSVRGYPTDSLGPVEELGEVSRPLGGKTLVVINQELRFDLLGPVAGLVFLDVGNVWEDTAEFSSDLFKSVGLGVRAVTPVGLLRLDWAFPLDRREDDPSSKVYFGFGNTF